MCGWALGWDSSVNPRCFRVPETSRHIPEVIAAGGHRGLVGAELPVSLTRSGQDGLGPHGDAEVS